MGNKTFQDRVIEEFRDFETAYSHNITAWKIEAHSAEIESSLNQALFDSETLDEEQRPERSNDARNPWERAFDIPFENAEKPPAVRVKSGKDKKKRSRSRPASGYDAIIETIQDLDLDELRLGSVVSDDVRVDAALSLGLLESYQLAPLYSLCEDEQRSLGMGPVFRNKLDSRDPVFWRTLLEMLCRAYMSSGGRPPWTTMRKVRLAFDIWEIVAKTEARDWDETRQTLEKVLHEQEPYRSRYKVDHPNPTRKAVGADTIEEVLNWLRPMDDGDPYERIEERFPIEFSEAMSERAKAKSSSFLTLDEIKRRLEQAGKMRDHHIEVFGLAAATRMLRRSIPE
jgi:hypothetical protein